MRKFPYIVVKQLLNELSEEGVSISRVTFYRLEKRLKLPLAKRTTGKLKWRVYSREEADQVKERIKQEYNIVKRAMEGAPAMLVV